MAGQQLPTQEERRQEVEQLSAAKLTDELERVRENLNKQLLAQINDKEREEERKWAQEQQDRLEQIQAASAKAAQALKEDETQAYLKWLKTQPLEVKKGIPTRPMFKDEFEEKWQQKVLAIPAWDLGIFGTPQADPVGQYKKRDDGNWRWEQRECSVSVFGQHRHPICKSSSRKLASLGPVEPASEPDPDNVLVRLAAEVAKASSTDPAAKQQHRKETGTALRRPKKISGQHAKGSSTPQGTHKSKRTSADKEAASQPLQAAAPAAAVAGKLKSSKQTNAAYDKAVCAVNPRPSNASDEAAVRAMRKQLAEAAAAAATKAAAKENRKQQKKAAKAAAAAAVEDEQQPLRKGGSADFSERVSCALHKAASKLRTFGSFGSSSKRNGSDASS